MTFEEFKKLALNPPYIEQKSAFRVDVHRFVNLHGDATDVLKFDVKLCQSFMYTDRQTVQRMLPRFIHKEYLNQQLYALYIYQLPVNKDVSDNLYQRLWVYDRNGNLNAKSMSTTLIEDLDTSAAKFRGRSAESIRFRPGDIVEVYDRENGIVRLGVVVKQPPTIQQCWDMRKEVERACLAEGIGPENTDANYWLYAADDCYCIMFSPDSALSYPHTTDVFTPMYPVSNKLHDRFEEYYHSAIAIHKSEIATNKITEETSVERIQEIRRRVDLL